MSDDLYNLIVIGGGAAGVFGAIQTAEQLQLNGKKGRILILERSAGVLQKVRISGGGRCNVTHDCHEVRELVKNYPRGEKVLLGPFYQWAAQNTIDWFDDNKVKLKIEPDGRMFPTTDSSQTIIDLFTNKIQSYGIELQTRQEVLEAKPIEGGGFLLETKTGSKYQTKHLLVATGGTRLKSSEKLPLNLGHEMIPPVPSLFTFDVKSPLLIGLEGLSVANVKINVVGSKLETTGPLLVTHWGISGPAVLKLSAWGAAELAKLDYQFNVQVDWLNGAPPLPKVRACQQKFGKKLIKNQNPFEDIPKRFWIRLLDAAHIKPEITWAQIKKEQLSMLLSMLNRTEFQVLGKSINKDEFVTAGGVKRSEVNFKTMESKVVNNLFLAGEVLDVDGVTGGFNFQNAWTTAFLAAKEVSQRG